MWRATEITVAEPYLCALCCKPMTPEWEERKELDNGGNQRSTVFHCEHCDKDVRLIREFDSNNTEMAARVCQFFFG